MRNNHVTIKVLMLWFGMYPQVCLFLFPRVEVLGMLACCSLCWRVAKGLQVAARVFAGGSVIFADCRCVAWG